MEPSTQLLTQRLQELPDAELLAHLREGTLIPQALEIAMTILRSRGLLPSAQGASFRDHHTPPAARAREAHWVMVAELVDPREADVLRVHLESHGVLTFVSSERPHVSPIASDRHGHPPETAATRLHVRQKQLWQAKEALAAFAKEQEVPEGLFDQDPQMPTCRQGTQPALQRKPGVRLGRCAGRLLVVLVVLTATVMVGIFAAG